MIAFIDDHREFYGVEPICKVLPIAPSTYQAHVARRAIQRSNRPVLGKTRCSWADPAGSRGQFGVYGARKVWRQLGREGMPWPAARWNA
jgi:hypothetical protein